MANLLPLVLVLQISMQDTSRCSQEFMYEMVDKLVKKNRTEFNYKKMIKETKCFYIVEYMPKDTMVIGGGIIATICKKECKIISYKLSQ